MADIFERGAAQQRSESQQQWINTGANLAQTALGATALGLGVTSGVGAGLMLASGAIGGVKGARSAMNGARKHLFGGKETARANAMQVLSYAAAGDPETVAALQQLGVPTENLGEPAVWELALSRLRDVMPTDHANLTDGRSGLPGEAVDIGRNRPNTGPLYEGIAYDGSSPVNPLGRDPHAQDFVDVPVENTPQQQQTAAALTPNAGAVRDEGEAPELSVFQRPAMSAYAANATAMDDEGGSRSGTPGSTTGGSPASEELKVEDVADGEGQTFAGGWFSGLSRLWG